MFKQIACVTAILVTLPVAAQNADPAEVDAVVNTVKAAHSDMKALCQQGADGIRKASTEAVMGLMASGKVKGNPQAVGGAAGQKLGRECRGG